MLGPLSVPTEPLSACSGLDNAPTHTHVNALSENGQAAWEAKAA